MTGVLRRGELEAVKTWVQLSLKTPRYIFPKMPRSANYIAERGNQKNTSFLIFSSLSNLYQPQCAARGAGFVRTQRLIDWIPSPHDEVAAKLNMCPSGGGDR